MMIIILQHLFLEAILDLLYFPLWWYSAGIKHAGRRCWHLFKNGNDNLAPGLWLRNIFVPMFGQYDFQGRLVSIFMRLANVIGRGIALFFWLIVCVGLFLFWLAFPILMTLGFVFSVVKLAN